MSGSPGDQNPEQERLLCVLDVPDETLLNCSQDTDMVREQTCTGLRTNGSRRRGLSPAKFPFSQHSAHSRMNVHLPRSVDIKRVIEPEESSRMETRKMLPRGNDGPGPEWKWMSIANWQRGVEARMGAPWGQGPLSALFTAPSCEPWSRDR